MRKLRNSFISKLVVPSLLFGGMYGLYKKNIFANKLAKCSTKIEPGSSNENYLNYDFVDHTQLKNASGSPEIVSTVMHGVNNPIEDRYSCAKLDNYPGGAVYLGVFDGHRGYQVSDYVSKRLHQVLNEKFIEMRENNSYEKNVDIAILALKEAFAQVEKELYNYGYNLYLNGNGKQAIVGSCALVALILEKDLIIANLGDSKAKLYKKVSDDYYEPIKVMDRHNSEKPKEIDKLRKRFPNEKDIVVCKRPGMKVCYAKGRLQPTRTFGDFDLKHKEFNDSQFNFNSNYRSAINYFTGPYISSEPEIRVFPYSQGDILVIATDGLWDEMNTKQISESLTAGEINDAAPRLLNDAIQRAANRIGISADQMNMIPAGGRKRNYMDDITIIVAKF